MMPSLSVVQGTPVAAQEGHAGALLATECHRAIEQAVDEPLETDGDLEERSPQRSRDAVLKARGDERLADGGAGSPVAGAAEEVPRRSSEDMVGVQQPDPWRDHAEAVGIGIVAEGHVEVVAHGDESSHRERG